MIPIMPASVVTTLVFIELMFHIHALLITVPISWNCIVTIRNKIRG
jgi:hypothetical protein